MTVIGNGDDGDTWSVDEFGQAEAEQDEERNPMRGDDKGKRQAV